MRTCARCGVTAGPDAHFCPQCGSPLPAPATPFVTPDDPYGHSSGLSAPARYPEYEVPLQAYPADPYPPPYPAPMYPSPAPAPAGGYWPPSPAPVESDARRQLRRRLLIIGVASIVLVAVAIGAALTLTGASRKSRNASAVAGAPTLAPGLTRYRFDAGHFSAGFAHEPQTRTFPASFASVRMDLFAAGSPMDQTVVESVVLSQSGSAADTQQLLDGAVGGLAVAGGMKVTHQRSTNFRGQTARQLDLTSPSGGKYTSLIIVASPQRYYLLIAPAGAEFDDLAASFDELP